jgi:hypothetical protein
LENKREGIQKRTYELIKDDLYNGKTLINDWPVLSKWYKIIYFSRTSSIKYR